MGTHRTTLTLEICGATTELEAEVRYNFFRRRPMRREGPMMGPEEPAHCEIDEIIVNRALLMLALLSVEQLAEIEAQCLENHDE